LLPQLPDFNAMARQRLEQQVAMEPLPSGITREQTLRSLVQQITIENHAIRPSGQKQWNFGVMAINQTGTMMTLQYRLSSSIIGQDIVKSRWLIGTTDQPGLIDLQTVSVPRTVNELSFTIDGRWKNKNLILTYIDVDTSGASYIFDPDNGMVLLSPKGSFAANYVRALLIIFGRLSFFAALGITAGSLFSLPVAAFVSLFLLLLIQMGSYIQGIAQTEIILPWQAATPDEAMTWLAIVVTLIFKGLAILMSPLLHESVLNNISTGRMVNIAWTFKGFFMQGVVYSMLLGWFAAYMMNRREFALPSE